MVVVPATFYETVVPTNVVGTTVHINSLKIGQITKPCQSCVFVVQEIEIFFKLRTFGQQLTPSETIKGHPDIKKDKI